LVRVQAVFLFTIAHFSQNFCPASELTDGQTKYASLTSFVNPRLCTEIAVCIQQGHHSAETAIIQQSCWI